MKFQFKKIVGISADFVFEHRILNAVTVVGIFISFLACTLNYLTEMPVITVYGAFLIGVGYMILFFYSIKSKNFVSYYYVIFSFIIFIFAPVFWIIGAGSFGTIPYFLIFTLVIINITSKNNTYLYFSILLFIVVIILLIIEYKYPQVIITYQKKEDRLPDIFIGFMLASIAIVISLKIFMNLYRSVLNTEIEQRIELQEKNEEILQ